MTLNQKGVFLAISRDLCQLSLLTTPRRIERVTPTV